MKNEIRIVIAGSRNFTDYKLLKEQTDAVINEIDLTKNYITIISGGARGADTLAEKYAKEMKYNLEVYPAQWGLFGKKAGYIRNCEMVAIADKVIVFWDGLSKGTKHTMSIAQKQGVELIVNTFMED